MNESGMSENHNHEEIRELTWRGKLSPAQQKELETWLALHPEEKESLALDARLTDSVQKLADTPVSSNFTARVLEQVRLEQGAAERASRQRTSSVFRWRWLIRTATAAVLVAAAGVTWKQAESARTAEEIARSVTLVSEVTSLPDAEVLRDFEAIQAMSQNPAADMELLALLK
jgi:anti-sigma factor RsiW